MQSLRQAAFLARLVLAWFALAIGVAVASPLVKPQAIELICSGSGAMKVLVKGDDGKPAASHHTLDCPLCATLDAPPPEKPLPSPRSTAQRTSSSAPTSRQISASSRWPSWPAVGSLPLAAFIWMSSTAPRRAMFNVV
jgi:hypothetical protein